MRTATVRDLRNKSAELLAWIEAGEEITISKRGTIVARLIPDSEFNAQKVDWTASAAFRMDRSQMNCLTEKQVRSLLSESQGHW